MLDDVRFVDPPVDHLYLAWVDEKTPNQVVAGVRRNGDDELGLLKAERKLLSKSIDCRPALAIIEYHRDDVMHGENQRQQWRARRSSTCCVNQIGSRELGGEGKSEIFPKIEAVAWKIQGCASDVRAVHMRL